MSTKSTLTVCALCFFAAEVVAQDAPKIPGDAQAQALYEASIRVQLLEQLKREQELKAELDSISTLPELVGIWDDADGVLSALFFFPDTGVYVPASVGDPVSEYWTVADIDETSVALANGRKRHRLVFGRASRAEPTTRPSLSAQPVARSRTQDR